MKNDMRPFQSWFGRYTRRFLKNFKGDDRNALALKIYHSQQVRKIIKELSKRIGLSRKEIFMAEISGLFHDIGRFEQFRKYHTFYDLKSEDHAALSCNVLKKEGVLDTLSGVEKDLVLDSIFVHNKFSIPQDFKGLKLTISKLLRDADKIDIWRVFDDFYQMGKGSSEINLGLPMGEKISEKVFSQFMKEEIVNIKDVKSQVDFMVMRLSWLYDINFKESLLKIVKRGYIDTIFRFLPEDEKRNAIREKIFSFLEKRGAYGKGS